MGARGVIVLEDGTTLEGAALGATGTAFGEVVFNTAMSGYEEVLTDPSYTRQIVVMTAVQQGNYGITQQDAESDRFHPAGFVVRAASRIASNYRARTTLPAALAAHGVIGLAEVDTRLLTRRIREHGALRGAVSSEATPAELLAEVARQPVMAGSDLATGVSVHEPYTVPAPTPPTGRDQPYEVVCLDFGLKRNQLRLLTAAGCTVTVVPATTSAEDILARSPDGLFCSNGPGDPAAVLGPVRTIRDVVAAGVPTFGICLGHQLLGLAAGARSYKLPFGHHGVNQPIRHLARGTIEIASHNHGFALDRDSLPGPEGRLGRVEETHINLNDGTNAGIALADHPAFSVQYHPEAAPGPHDARYLFDDFVALMARTPRRVGGGR